MLYELTDDQVRTLRTLLADEAERVAEVHDELDEDEKADNIAYLAELRTLKDAMPSPDGPGTYGDQMFEAVVEVASQVSREESAHV